MEKIRIIQSSPPRTGSTLLLNLVHGFLSPDEPIHWCEPVDKYLITKTHDTNIDRWIKKYPNYELYFIMSERQCSKVNETISDKYRDYGNVLIVNYSQINGDDLDAVTNNIFSILLDFLPKELIPRKEHNLIKGAMKRRIINMNQLTEKIKNKPFSYWDKFYGIHGSHRSRS